MTDVIVSKYKEYTGVNKPRKKLTAELGNFYGSLIRFIEQNEIGLTRRKHYNKQTDLNKNLNNLKFIKQIKLLEQFQFQISYKESFEILVYLFNIK
jgi:hypothetical protein